MIIICGFVTATDVFHITVILSIAHIKILYIRAALTKDKTRSKPSLCSIFGVIILLKFLKKEEEIKVNR